MKARPTIRTLGAALLAMAALLAPAAAQAAPPTIANTSASLITTTSARLGAEVNPQGKATLYHFEYGPQDCSANPCTAVPVPEAEITAGSAAVAVFADIEALQPHTTYHFRLIAKNFGEGGGETKGPDATFTTRLQPPPFGPCPNDPFRSGIYAPAGHPSAALPDCRAYEQASPLDKNGADARGTALWTRAAEDGSAISFLSSSGFPGGVGQQQVPTYLASRGTSGWSTQGLLPPAALGSSGYVRGWLPDFSAVFDEARDLGSGEDGLFLSRSSADGTYDELVGHDAGGSGFSYVGASADGSRVLFETSSALSCCPGALAGKPNVYLWDRDSGQISLASVLNDGSPPPKGAVAGPYDWMAKDAPALSASGGGAAAITGEYYLQDPHATSAAGDLFFTETGGGALYLRRNPTQPQSPLDGQEHCTDPALACTIEVSASHRTPPDTLGHRPAAFIAASADGSHAFFTSPEELTNDANTGPEAQPPLIQRAPAAGPPIAEEAPITALGIAKDSQHLYWVNPQASAIGRSDLDGGNPDPTFIEIPPHLECPPDRLGRTFCLSEDEEEVPANPQYVTVDSGHIYWTNERSGNIKTGSVGRAAIDGDPESVRADWIPGITHPKGIAVDNEYVYWAQAGLGVGGGANSEPSIGRAKKSNGGELNPRFMPNALNGYPGNSGGFPEGVAVDANHIYWTAKIEVGSELYRADVADGSDPKFHYLGNDTGARGIALDSQYLYWASQGKEAIGRLPIADFTMAGSCAGIPSCEPNFIPTDGTPFGLAADGTDLRWSVNGAVPPNPGNDLYRFDAGGEALTDLTPDSADLNGAQVRGVLGASDDARRVYFVANADLDGAGEAQPGDCAGYYFNYTGQCSLYLAQEGDPGSWTTTFIARLDASGNCFQSDAANWIAKARLTSPDCRLQRTAFTSADGGVLLFRSQQRLTGYDNRGLSQLYRYEADSDHLACVSCNPTGQAPGGLRPDLGAARLGSIGLGTFEPEYPAAAVQARNLSTEGNRVFFESVEPLVAADTNGSDGCQIEGSSFFQVPSCLDVYEWEAEGTGTCEEDVQAGGCLYLLSTGTSPRASVFLDASESGDDAFLATLSSGLVAQDTDGVQDIFDVRVDGGLAAQNQPPPAPPCESAEACHGPPSPPPPFESPPDFNGPGNVQEKPCKKGFVRKHGKCVPRPCRKGKVRRHGRCVKKSSHKPKHHKKARAHANRGAAL